MADYTNEYSTFPENLITMKEYKDITDDIAAIVGEIETAKAAGNFSQALEIIKAHPELSDYNFSASDINRIIEEIRNAQIFAQSITKSITYGNDSFSGDVGDVWIGEAGYENIVSAPSEESLSQVSMRSRSLDETDETKVGTAFLKSDSMTSLEIIPGSEDNRLIFDFENGSVKIPDTYRTGDYIYLINISLTVEVIGNTDERDNIISDSQNSGIQMDIYGMRDAGAPTLIGTRFIPYTDFGTLPKSVDFSAKTVSNGFSSICPMFSVTDAVAVDVNKGRDGFKITYGEDGFNVALIAR